MSNFQYTQLAELAILFYSPCATPPRELWEHWLPGADALPSFELILGPVELRIQTRFVAQ